MEYVALKPCRFGGQEFRVGETIPGELIVAPNNAEKMGVVAPKGAEIETEPSAEFIGINVHVQEGDMELKLSKEGLQAFVDVITSKAQEAEAIIELMTDTDALILIDATDSRKSIKQAAKERALALNAAEAGDQ